MNSDEARRLIAELDDCAKSPSQQPAWRLRTAMKDTANFLRIEFGEALVDPPSEMDELDFAMARIRDADNTQKRNRLAIELHGRIDKFIASPDATAAERDRAREMIEYLLVEVFGIGADEAKKFVKEGVQ